MYLDVNEFLKFYETRHISDPQMGHVDSKDDNDGASDNPTTRGRTEIPSLLYHPDTRQSGWTKNYYLRMTDETPLKRTEKVE